MLDFVCVGDTAVDNFFFIDEATVNCDINDQNCTLNLKYGQKIPVTKHAVTLGGNAANVSVGLSRLGINANLVTIFGNDEHGIWLKKQLMTENVGIEESLTSGESNISAIIIFKGERTILSYHFPQTEQIRAIPPSTWLYLTSAPGTDSTGMFDMVKVLSPMPRLAFNPSVPDLKKGKDYLSPILEKTEILILNKEEFMMLGGRPACRQAGITVVTDGANGVTLYDGDKEVVKPAISVSAYEPTGAGDAFSSGFLAGLYYGKSLEEALDWGLENAASVIQKIGAIEGLSRIKELKGNS